MEGPWPLDMIQHFVADKAFFGADCLDTSAGLTTPSIAVASIELAMVRRTRGEVVVLADSSKIGLVAPLVICPLDQVDVILVDDGVDAGSAWPDRERRPALRGGVAKQQAPLRQGHPQPDGGG